MATQAHSHYDTLCVPPTATQDEIRTGWRRLVRNFHPDVAGDAGIVMTQKLNAAYAAIGTPNARRAYDRELLLDAEPVREPTPEPVHEPTYEPPVAPKAATAPTATAAPAAAWDAERYKGLRKASLISYAVIGLGIVVSAAALNSTHSSIELIPIAAAAIITAARQRMATWRALVLGVAIVALPLALLGVWGFSNWFSDSGAVAMIAQALVAVAAFVARSIGVPIRALRAARPRK